MKKVILCASIVSLLAAVAQAQNETVTWGNPTTISGPGDVDAQGTYFGSWAPNLTAAGSLTVNGVTFQGSSDLPGLNSTFDNSTGSGSFASPGTSDSNYNTLMTSGAFGNNATPYSLTWDGMTAGNTYLVELWVNDGRVQASSGRTETVTGGANTSGFLDYGESVNGGPGQWITGTFVADSSGSETLTLTPGPNIPSAQLNLFQVRDISPVPEPSTFAFLAAGAGAMFCGFRRKSRV
jgi:hypothetical protein